MTATSGWTTLLLTTMLVCSACRAQSGAGAPPGGGEPSSTASAVTVGHATAAPLVSAQSSSSATAKKPGLACPVVEMKMVSTMAGLKPTTQMQLSKTGELDGPLLSLTRKDFNLRLDPRGCVVSNGSVWVERVNEQQLWTERQLIKVDGNKVFPAAHYFEIHPDGRVTDSRGNPDETVMRFEGYQPEGLCAAQMMLMAYLGMMPSMAAVDGVAPKLEPPATSVCADARTPSPP